MRWAMHRTVQSLNLCLMPSWINPSVLAGRSIKMLQKKSTRERLMNALCSSMVKMLLMWKKQFYLWSTLAVASSMTRILLFLSMALARHTNCLCPTLNLLPPSPASISKPSDTDFTFSSR